LMPSMEGRWPGQRTRAAERRCGCCWCTNEERGEGRLACCRPDLQKGLDLDLGARWWRGARCRPRGSRVAGLLLSGREQEGPELLSWGGAAKGKAARGISGRGWTPCCRWWAAGVTVCRRREGAAAVLCLRTDLQGRDAGELRGDNSQTAMSHGRGSAKSKRGRRSGLLCCLDAA